VKDDAAFALVHGVHTAAGTDEDTKDNDACANQGNEGCFAAHGVPRGGFEKLPHDTL
jgi:hypothetical protein